VPTRGSSIRDLLARHAVDLEHHEHRTFVELERVGAASSRRRPSSAAVSIPIVAVTLLGQMGGRFFVAPIGSSPVGRRDARDRSRTATSSAGSAVF
jgi:hypothetical protein